MIEDKILLFDKRGNSLPLVISIEDQELLKEKDVSILRITSHNMTAAG